MQAAAEHTNVIAFPTSRKRAYSQPHFSKPELREQVVDLRDERLQRDKKATALTLTPEQLAIRIITSWLDDETRARIRRSAKAWANNYGGNAKVTAVLVGAD